ncbi:MAG: HD domain-containing protein [Chloroflexota bacterium]|nr:HD domain-containing protein [Chloroflexota bacterium]
MRSWLAACRQIAHEASLPEDRERLGWDPNDERIPPFRYRWEHVKQVVQNGRWLLTQVEADEETVLAACWLHDVKKGAEDHAMRGAQFAREFLPHTDFPPGKIEAVTQAIAVHQGLFRPADDWRKDSDEPFRPAPPMKPIEAALLWDADKLSKVGPIALLHYLSYELATLERRGESTTTEGLHERNRKWLETMAPRILASFNTRAAQRRAIQLHGAYETFWMAAEEVLRDT